jgi:activator of HSP90 ATPase
VPCYSLKTREQEGVIVLLEMEATGSVWNANSWHWEERNYNTWAKQWIKEKLNEVAFETEGWAVQLTETPSLEGEASISIRKGKQIVTFEFDFECKWTATKGEENQAGRLKVPQFDQDEIEDIQVEVTVDTLADSLRSSIRRQVQPRLISVLNRFVTELKALESSEAKVKADKKRREEELARMQQATIERGTSQEELLKKAKDEEHKRWEEARKTKLEAENAVAGQGSEWNYGSYFWEEKSVSWANDRLKGYLGAVKVSIPAGYVQVMSVELTGEAGINIRKGKKLTLFNYEVTGTWESKLVDGEGTELGKATGEYLIHDISQECEDSYEVEFRAVVSTNDQLTSVSKTELQRALTAEIRRFVEELRQA